MLCYYVPTAAPAEEEAFAPSGTDDDTNSADAAMPSEKGVEGEEEPPPIASSAAVDTDAPAGGMLLIGVVSAYA